MKKGIIILFIFLSLSSYGQQTTSLGEQLWDKVEPCYEMFEDYDEDGKLDYDELIDDSKNGYLKVAGSFPGCGCTCENTVAAFKTAASEYVFLQKDIWACSWHFAINSSRSLKELFPINFEANGFFNTDIAPAASSATFYLDMDIPQHGTDVKVKIKTIPFGLEVKSQEHIQFSYSEETGYNEKSSQVQHIQEIARKIQDPNTLEYLLNNEPSKITYAEMLVILPFIGEGNYKFNDLEALRLALRDLKNKYDLHKQIKHEWLILAWDRAKASFYVKEKGAKPKNISFLEFLRTSSYWMAVC